MKRSTQLHSIISDLMRVKNISQADVHRRIGISKTTLSNFLNGKSNITSDYLTDILSFLGVDLIKVINDNILKKFKTSKAEKSNIYNDIEILLDAMDKKQKSTIIKHILITTSLLKCDDEVQARENLIRHLRGRI